MRSCSRSKQLTITKMTEFGQKILPVFLPSSATFNTPNLWWYGLESVHRAKLRRFSSNPVSRLMLMSINVIFWSPLYCHGPSNILKATGPFNKILLLHTRLEQLNTGFQHIFLISSLPKNGLPTARTLIQWTTVFGRFWRPEHVQNLTEIWRLWDAPFLRSGTKYPKKRCAPSQKILRSASGSVSRQREAILKPLKYVITVIVIYHWKPLDCNLILFKKF